jgi:hypothetical protein
MANFMLHAHVISKTVSQTIDLSCHSKKLEKEEQTQPKAKGKIEMVKMRELLERGK